MRALLSVGLMAVFCASIARADDQNAAIADALKILQGKWRIADMEIDGRKVQGLMTKVVFNDEAYMLERKGEIVVDGTWEIVGEKGGDLLLDITLTSKKAEYQSLLRVVDSNKLMLCMHHDPAKKDGDPRPTAMQTSQGSRRTLLTLKRVK